MDGRTRNGRRLGEFELIAKLFAPLAEQAPGALGLADDAALFAPPAGEEFVVTVDAVVEGVDFFQDDPPQEIAHKALRVNLSDLAAKGAKPSGYLLTLLLPSWPDEDWLDAFAAGLADDQERYGLSLMGGDTSAIPGPLAISITAFGTVPKGAMLRRRGAAPGDLVYVSGTIGDAWAGLKLRRDGGCTIRPTAEQWLVDRYLRPEPRMGLGLKLRGLADAALDVSDGLLADLGHIAATSGVRIVVEEACIPLSAAFVAVCGRDKARSAATAGDDYEIAFTAPPAKRAAIEAAAETSGVPVREIGRVEVGSGVVLLDCHGSEVSLERIGYQHF